MRIKKLDAATKAEVMKVLTERKAGADNKFEVIVNDIIANIRANGDSALFGYTKEFDKADINASNVLVTEEEIAEAYTQVDEHLVEVIRKAIANIRDFHSRQKQNSWFESRPDGTILGQKVTALQRVGVYVPGG